MKKPGLAQRSRSRLHEVRRWYPTHLVWMLSTIGAVAQAQERGPAAAQPSDAQMLPAIQVQGVAEDPQGPGVGYVAKRSQTGTKTAAALLTNPQSISVITREQMDDLGAQTVDQALRYTAGVYTQDGTDIRFDQINGRGFGLDSYLDGLHLYTSPRFAVPRIDPYFVNRIDVLHGPASVLYGQGSPGGLVNYLSKLPMAEPYHEVLMQIGNHANYQLGFDFSGPVDAGGTVLYRVTGVARTAETQVRQIKDQRLALAPALTIRPNRDTQLTLQASLQRDPNGGLFNPAPASGTVFRNPHGQFAPDRYFGDSARDDMQRTQYGVGYQFEHTFNDTFSVSQNLRYLQINQRYYQTSVATPFAVDQQTVGIWANTDRERFSQFAVDTHAQAKFSTGVVQHTVLFGIDYQRVRLNDRTGGGLSGTVNLFAPDYRALPKIAATTQYDYGLSTLGLYTQDEVRYRNWVLTLGLREDLTGTNQQQQSATGATLSHADDRALTYRAGLAYRFESGMAPFVSYAKSFQPVPGLTFHGTPFTPTKGKQIEAGVRYQPTGGNAYLSLSAYTLTQDNVATADPLHPMFTVQTGQIRSRGIDAEAHANATENLKLIASYAYLQQTVTASTTPAVLGKRPPLAPRHTAALWADYTFHRGPLRNFGLGSGVRYVSHSEGAADNSFAVPARVLIDVGVHYDLSDWRLAVNVSNLFNREYISSCSSAVSCYWGATRTILGTARYQW